MFAIIMFFDDIFEIRFPDHRFEPIECLADAQCATIRMDRV